MRWLLLQADSLLRGAGRFLPDPAVAPPLRLILLIAAIFAAIYGAFMGTFRLDSPERLLQVLYSAIKLPLLLLATTCICLPGFVVLNTVLGLRSDLRKAFQAILAGQAALSLALAALAPITRFFYFSSDSYRAALLFNAAAFAVATWAGQLVIRRYYRVLIAKRPQHRWTLYAWLVIYSFVGIQMGWTLRPFVGDPGLRVTFFRAEPFTNAYVVIAHLIFRR